MLEGQAAGFTADPNETVADYLTAWLEDKQLVLKPTTYVRYRDYVAHDLIPALGQVKLDDLAYSHIAAFVHAQLDAGRGKVTVHRCLATLSSALGEAVRHHRLPSNPARPTVIPRPAAAERHIWTVSDAVHFLHSCRTADPAFADFIEVLIGSGLRKGEALALHWDDIHLDERVLYVRYTLSAVDNNRLVITAPKTRSSKDWVAISRRVADALQHRAYDKGYAATRAPHGGFVFHRPDGQPLHPQYALNHFHDLCRAFGAPRTTLHDLRHLAATISINAGVPLTVVSKTLRHSTLSTTANIYSHLTAPAALDAVNTIDRTLTTASDAPPGPPPTIDLTSRPHTPQPQSTHHRQHPAAGRRMTPRRRRPRRPALTTDITPPSPDPKTRKRPSSHVCENGLRPAKTLVGTTGFEPATP
ncbi:site-specific integrase [Streptomyces sp. SID13666]|uniref:tyrosine-type recombinase/integrase n=1 Tax=unclassified Streptomyces TaxID=2593676 RepID=UPI0013C007CD|nr:MULTISPECIES: site-specific integrase [unclassified Streptomyces]NEA60454.1 site-specific integrase [Streptomyces sp. SID13666]NEA73784.1 site-specific integrase [Streptomyces sp. SID13588]